MATAMAVVIRSTQKLMITVALLLKIFAVQAVDFEYPDETLSLLAFGSCHKRKYPNPRIWESVRAKSPQAWLWTGDSIYPPQRGVADLATMETEYHHMHHNQSVGYNTTTTTRRSAPSSDNGSEHWNLPLGVFGTWDDHDYGGNDVGIRMEDKQKRADLFWNFLQLPKPTGTGSGIDDGTPSQQRQGVYHSVTWGQHPRQVKAIMLDTRWHRKDHCIPSLAPLRWLPLGAGISCLLRWFSAAIWPALCHASATAPDAVLGSDQWEWLELELEDSEASVHVVVSSIQVMTTNPVMETWGHFPAEQARLLRMVGAAKGAFILSGDVHHAEIIDSTAGVSGLETMLEVTSSGLTHDCSMPIYGRLCRPLLESFSKHRWSPDAYFIGRNFGTLEIDWDKVAVTVEVNDSAGQQVLSTGTRLIEAQQGLTSEHINRLPAVMDGHLEQPTVVLVAVCVCTIGLLFQMTRK